MIRIFIGNLAPDASDEEVMELFKQYGTVREMRLVRDLFTNKCRGFGVLDMEGHEARAAIAGLDGFFFKGKPIKVKEEIQKGKGKKRGRR